MISTQPLKCRSLTPWLFSLAAFVACPGVASAEVSRSFALLQNGNVLDGEIRLVDGQYRVVNEGSEIRLRPADVAHIAESKLSLYDWQRGSQSAPTADDHLKLSEWCAKQQLWQQAAKELLDARSRDPRHRRIAFVERRLQQAWKRSQATPAPGADEAAAAKRMAEAAREAEQRRLLNTLPEGALEVFTRRIQPILVNNCSNGGCHQSSDSEFPIDRALLHGLADRRSTIKNLSTVMSAIDRDNPLASPLLRASSGPHADRPMGILTGRRRELYDRVTEWVTLFGPEYRQPQNGFAGRPNRYAVQQAGFISPIGGGFRPPVGAQQPMQAQFQQPQPAAIPYQGLQANPSAAPATKSPAPEAPKVAPTELAGESYEPLTEAPKQLKPKPVEKPRDEFDPEIFNRTHRGE